MPAKTSETPLATPTSGRATAPTRPTPKPASAPCAPCSCAPMTGAATRPATPAATPPPMAMAPRKTPPRMVSAPPGTTFLTVLWSTSGARFWFGADRSSALGAALASADEPAPLLWRRRAVGYMWV